MKIKPILPSLREKKRFIVFEIISKEGLSFENIKHKIDEGIRSFIGVKNFSKAGLLFVKNKKDKAIIKVSHKSVDEVKAALTLVNDDFIINILGVSGILKKAIAKYY